MFWKILGIIVLSVFVTDSVWNYIKGSYEGRARNFIKENSRQYLYAKKLYDDLQFGTEEPDRFFNIPVKSKATLDKLTSDQLVFQTVKNDKYIQNLMRRGVENNRKADEYKDAVLSYQSGQMTVIPNEFNFPHFIKYDKIEDSLLKELEDKVKKTIPKIHFKFEYDSPAGRNHYEKERILHVDEYAQLLKRISEIEKRKETAKYQRSLMNSSLRYDILRRDGFRCVICGRGVEDGVKLHVDHIIPVSKGGKTEPNNLRTLCEECNLGKSDKYKERGVN